MPSDTNDPLRVRDSRTGMMGRRGDFEGDLLPGGIQTGLPGGPPPFGGSQVGPNHPMFDDEDNLYNNPDDFGGAYGPPSFGIPGVGGGNMGSMRPRFDPYGPPGGPTEPGRGGRGGVVEVALAVGVVAEGEDAVCLLVDLEIPTMITCNHPTVITLVKNKCSEC